MSMRSIMLGISLAGLLVPCAQAADLASPPPALSGGIPGLEALQPDMSSSDLSGYVGLASLIVIFADAPDDADFVAQIDILRPSVDDLVAQNVVLLTDTAPSESGPLRQSLRPRGFSIILIDSTGTLVQRRGTVTDAQMLIRQIEQMP
jgi:hypothetical protein